MLFYKESMDGLIFKKIIIKIICFFIIGRKKKKKKRKGETEMMATCRKGWGQEKGSASIKVNE